MMTPTGNKVLACVDQSPFADHVADYAAWAAKLMDAPLELLHVIDRHSQTGSPGDFSGAIGIDAGQNLLTKLSAEDAARSKSSRDRGRMFLNQLRERAVAAGALQTDSRQRFGELQETLIEQAEDVALVVMGRRGESAQPDQRTLGRHVEGVVRKMKIPILTVTDSFREPSRALVAFDGSAATKRGIAFVAASPLCKGMAIYLLMAGNDNRDARKTLDCAAATLEAAQLKVTASYIPGEAQSVITQSITEHAIDLCIMGAFGHSPIRNMFFGSKTSGLLGSMAIPTLLVR